MNLVIYNIAPKTIDATDFVVSQDAPIQSQKLALDFWIRLQVVATPVLKWYKRCYMEQVITTEQYCSIVEIIRKTKIEKNILTQENLPTFRKYSILLHEKFLTISGEEEVTAKLADQLLEQLCTTKECWTAKKLKKNRFKAIDEIRRIYAQQMISADMYVQFLDEILNAHSVKLSQIQKILQYKYRTKIGMNYNSLDEQNMPKLPTKNQSTGTTADSFIQRTNARHESIRPHHTNR